MIKLEKSLQKYPNMVDERWTSFKILADIKAPTRDIYNAWTTGPGLEKWFLQKAQFFSIAGRERSVEETMKRDDTYEWYWHGFENKDGVEKGRILEANGTNFLRFTFTGKCIVSVSISSKNGMSIVELKQENIPQQTHPEKNLYVGCQMGWQFYLVNLKSILEGGIDLRNKRVDVQSSFK